MSAARPLAHPAAVIFVATIPEGSRPDMCPSRLPMNLIAVDWPTAMPGQAIGVMGGSFNPPHAGHRHVAETALRCLRLDRVRWLVSPGNPLKDNGALVPLADRRAATEDVARHPRHYVTSFEADLGTPYTAEMLAALKTRFPRTRFVWIMGADSLAGMHRWRNWREIAARVPFAVVDRPGWRLQALASPAARAFASRRVPERHAESLARLPPPAWTFLSSRLKDESSTAIRASAATRFR